MTYIQTDDNISNKILVSHQMLVEELASLNKKIVDNTSAFSRRDHTARVLCALARYLMNAVPYETGKNSVDAIHELIGTFADIDNGKNTPLFAREIKTPNRNTKHGEGLAYDLIIAVRHYLIHQEKLEEGIAEDRVQQYLIKNGIAGVDVDNLSRTHNRASARNNKRPDWRNREIKDNSELQVTLEEIVKLLRHKSTSKTAPKI